MRDQGAAEDFLLDFIEYQREENGADFDRTSSGAFDLWVSEDIAYALSDQLLVTTTDERLMSAIIDRIAGEEDKSLHEDEYFKESRASLPTRRFTSLYVNGEKARSVIEDTEVGQYLDFDFYDEIPDWFAASAGWIEDGIVFDVVAPLSAEVASAAAEIPPLSAPARLMPSDTVAMLAFTFDPVVENWREVLEGVRFL